MAGEYLRLRIWTVSGAVPWKTTSKATYMCRRSTLANNDSGKAMVVGIFLAEFLLLLNTGPLNAAVINSVGPHVRATALAVNIFIFHLLGDVPSAYLIGYVSDKYSLQLAFLGPVITIALSSAILFYGMRFAPEVQIVTLPPETAEPAPAS